MTDSKQSEQPEQPGKSPEREPGDDPQAVEPASPEQSDASSTYRAESSTASPAEDSRPAGAGRTGRPLALGALLIALLALAMASYPFWPRADDSTLPSLNPQTQAMLSDLEAAVDRLEQAQQSLQREVDDQPERLQTRLQALQQSMDQGETLESMEIELRNAMAAATDRVNQRLAAIEGNQNSQQGAFQARLDRLEEDSRRQIEQLALRLDQFDSSLQNTDRSLAERLTLIQIDALLTLGQDKLVLERDPSTALLAWQRASSRIQPLDSAVFDRLKETLSQEQERLRAFANNHQPLTALERFGQLNRMADAVSQWPTLAEQADLGMRLEPEADQSWSARVGQALEGLVRIESVEEAGPSLPETEQAVTRIEQHLRAAALATARNDWALNQALIESAEEGLRAFFDVSAEPVARGLQELKRLEQAPEPAPLPELGGARDQVQRLLEQTQ